MKNLFLHLPEIYGRIRRKRLCILFLDFDGTLSPMAPTPARAQLPKKTKMLLRELTKAFSVVIVSGRLLQDIKRKINIAELNYAGNHGLEWQVGGKKFFKKNSASTVSAIRHVKGVLYNIQKAYPGMLVEDKKIGIAVHYRKVQKKFYMRLFAEVLKIFNPLALSKKFFITKGKKNIELRPWLSWTKGDFVKLYIRNFIKKYKEQALAIYIGDEVTDEDAFGALKTGITVRVGFSRQSKAKYYVRNQAEVLKFLLRLKEINKI